MSEGGETAGSGSGHNRTSPSHHRNTHLTASYTANKSPLTVSRKSSEMNGNPSFRDDVDGGEVSMHKVFHSGVDDSTKEHSRKSSSESGSSSVEGAEGSDSQSSEQEDNGGGVAEEGNSHQPPELAVR